MDTTSIYSVYDCKAKIYTLPYYSQNAETARREFSLAINGQGMIAHYPEDFTLFEMGTFKFEGGVTKLHSPPISICKGIELVDHSSELTPLQFDGARNFVDENGVRSTTPRKFGER